ncbi:uncharacterized protein BDW47DRAFT_132613 [Aspergillus candidus]|uniref:Uncharacterized protein n=1 Tax=Aspergillus candidus TaxID=41067 RepID=A0A2I2F868_ASPCN|nr:hypothetical protein BDW47DRAFT_132613 [Aspergillus candidus]PLB36811.1 hypothetical protein BDW47DRAFT_132613 [Aspergillus candidus]
MPSMSQPRYQMRVSREVPPPLPPIFNEVEFGDAPAVSRPTGHPQIRRPSSADKEIPQNQRIPSNESAKNQNKAPTVNQNSDNDLSTIDNPDSTEVPSDEYPSTISDDYFSQLLEPFGTAHEITEQNHGPGKLPLAFDELERESSFLTSSIDLQPLIAHPSPKELFATSASLSGSSSSASQHMDLASEDDCECTSSALKILETVAAPLKDTDWNTVERKLCFLKQILTRCIALSRCSSCAQDSGFTMLVLVLYDKITTTIEEAAQWWKRHLDTPTRLARQEAERAMHYDSREAVPWEGGSAQQPHMALGRYPIDTMEEHCKVLATLILLQLHRLVSLLSAARQRITSSKWEGHLALLTILRQRTKAVQVILNG